MTLKNNQINYILEQNNHEMIQLNLPNSGKIPLLAGGVEGAKMGVCMKLQSLLAHDVSNLHIGCT